MRVPDEARRILESDSLAHVTTIDPDGRPQTTLAWVGLEGDQVVFATLPDQRKLRNLRRDPRITMSIQTERVCRRDQRDLRLPEPSVGARVVHVPRELLGDDADDDRAVGIRLSCRPIEPERQREDHEQSQLRDVDQRIAGKPVRVLVERVWTGDEKQITREMPD